MYAGTMYRGGGLGSGTFGGGGTYGGGGAYGAGYAGGAGGAYGGAYGQQDCCTATCGAMGCGDGGGGAACGGAGCGGGGGTMMSYVGGGGDYVQETTYKYVGMGAGEFGVLRIPGRGPNCLCICLVPLLLSLLLIPLLLWLLTSSTSTTSTTTTPLITSPTPPPEPPPLPTTTSLPYDCEKGGESSWSTGKMAWCCDKYGKGCPTTPPPPDTTPPPPPTTPPPPPPPPTTTEKKIDCGEGDPPSWDVPKKVYCCLHVGKGCPTTPAPETTPPAPPTPTAPVPTAPVPTAPVPTAAPVSTTTPCPIDCYAGYNDIDPLQWVRGWSGAKKIYCCKTAHRGCPDELPPPSGLPPAPPSGLPPAPDTSVYDCDAGYHPCMHCLRESWSPAKIAYCCRTAHKGCQGEEPE